MEFRRQILGVYRRISKQVLKFGDQQIEYRIPLIAKTIIRRHSFSHPQEVLQIVSLILHYALRLYTFPLDEVSFNKIFRLAYEHSLVDIEQQVVNSDRIAPYVFRSKDTEIADKQDIIADFFVRRVAERNYRKKLAKTELSVADILAHLKDQKSHKKERAFRFRDSPLARSHVANILSRGESPLVFGYLRMMEGSGISKLLNSRVNFVEGSQSFLLREANLQLEQRAADANSAVE